MGKVAQLVTYKEKDNQERHKFFESMFKAWAEMEDLEEVIIVAKVKDQEMRYQISYCEDNFWWLGALSNLQATINDEINYNKTEYEDHKE